MVGALDRHFKEDGAKFSILKTEHLNKVERF